MSATRHHVGPVTRRPLRSAERVEWHYHTRSQLVYPGRGVLQVFTEAGAWIVPPLRGVWFPAGATHSHRAYGATDLLSVTFPASADPFGRQDPVSRRQEPVSRRQEPVVVSISPLLREVILALTAETPPPKRSAALLRRVVLDQLQLVRSLPVQLPQPRDDRLRRIAERLGADPSDTSTLAQLGREVGASERTLSRLFQRETGMSFPQWRSQLRLHNAQILLAEGESVTTTAQRCGYRSTSAFIEAFRNVYGSTPGHHAGARPPSTPGTGR